MQDKRFYDKLQCKIVQILYLNLSDYNFYILEQINLSYNEINKVIRFIWYVKDFFNNVYC